MKKFSKEDLIEKFNEMKDDVVKAKEFAEDLIYVTKGYVTEGLKREKEQYYINKKDLKEEMKDDIAYISDYNKRMAEKKENNPYFNPNSPLNENRENTDIEYSKVSIKSNFYENLQKGNGEVLDSLIKNDHYNNTLLNEYVVEKIEKINETTKNLNGAFKIEYAPDKATGTILNNVGENYIESFEFRPVNNTEFMDKLSNLYNIGKSETEKIELNYENFGNLTDASTYDKGNRNSKLYLCVLGGKEEENGLIIVSGDKKLHLKGDEINLGEMMSMRNATTFLFDKEEEKVEKHIKLAYEIENDVNKLKEDLLKQDFDTIKNNIFSSVLNNLEIKEKTENFQKDVSNIGDVVEEKFNKVFDDLGLGFKNNFLINNAKELNLTVSKPERFFSSTDKFGKEYFLQLIDEFDSEYESYEENVDFFLKNLCKEEAKDFEERVLCFGNNFSTNIEDKFTKEEFNADYKLLDKIDKVFEDTFEYAKNKNIDIKNEKELKALTDEVGLNLSDKRYEELVKDEHKEKTEDKKEERKVKDFFDFVDEEVKKDEKEFE